MTKRLLISLAHPDDESFGSGGLIAKYASLGAEVFYILGTDGAKGTVRPEFLEKYGSIHATRTAEMDCAAQVLGFKDVFKLGFGDSGMMGSADNDDPACLWQADEGQVAQQIGEIMRQIQPQVVITFDPYGAYGHPDHIFMHRATTRAFYAVKDEVKSLQKLYYTTFPKRLLQLFIWQMRMKGQNPRQAGVNKDLDLVAIQDNSLDVTTKIDVWEWVEIWDRASACHASQVGPRQNMPHWQRRLFAKHQGLSRVYPEWRAGEAIETDLFSHVTL